MLILIKKSVQIHRSLSASRKFNVDCDIHNWS